MERNRRERAGLQVTCNRLDKDCKEKCASLDAERVRFLSKHQATFPKIIAGKTSSPHREAESPQEYNEKLLLPPVNSVDNDGMIVSGRIRSLSDVTPARRQQSLHSRQAFSAKSYSTGTLHHRVKPAAQEYTAENMHEQSKHAALHLPHCQNEDLDLSHCTPKQGLASRKTSHFRIISIPVMTFVVLSKSLNDRRQLEALDLPFNQHIMRRKLQSDRDLEEKLNDVRNLRYLRTGKYTTE